MVRWGRSHTLRHCYVLPGVRLTATATVAGSAVSAEVCGLLGAILVLLLSSFHAQGVERRYSGFGHLCLTKNVRNRKTCMCLTSFHVTAKTVEPNTW